MPTIENGNYFWDGEGEPDYLLYTLLHGDFGTVARLARYLAREEKAVVRVACRVYGWEFIDCHAIRGAAWKRSLQLRLVHAGERDSEDSEFLYSDDEQVDYG